MHWLRLVASHSNRLDTTFELSRFLSQKPKEERPYAHLRKADPMTPIGQPYSTVWAGSMSSPSISPQVLSCRSCDRLSALLLILKAERSNNLLPRWNSGYISDAMGPRIEVLCVTGWTRLVDPGQRPDILPRLTARALLRLRSTSAEAPLVNLFSSA
ncbi:hypothetical protein BDP81DRAFT_18688 [Colletotrichum phormii]|uniref:Uncharacterized protein n=1 Tax=Colletotrichum phormii TaxID=359342 RepID=A0AAJ0EKC1_9PEZI|nr:uncharacterized protein BDP81DRAFT_18688 [Colletotrichum phormii]KAK1656265.1 hypothetical protein BDP81DRAFT_18688 [Colletotrichum phormii]